MTRPWLSFATTWTFSAAKIADRFFTKPSRRAGHLVTTDLAVSDFIFRLTIFLGHSHPLPKTTLSSRRVRSEVGGPAPSEVEWGICCSLHYAARCTHKPRPSLCNPESL